MDRRRALKTTTVLLAATPLAACDGRLETFTSWKQAQQAVLDLLFSEKVGQGHAWNLSQVLQHLAQSIEFSMQGFPALKGAWFRSSIGSAAFAVFNARGVMSHSLDEPIPGAPALDASQALKAVLRHGCTSCRTGCSTTHVPDVKPGDKVVARTDRGVEYALILTAPEPAAAGEALPPVEVLRRATEEDERRQKEIDASGRSAEFRFCRDKVEQIDYKNITSLRPFISEKGKIRSRRITGACRRHQVQVGRAVKRAREMALLPYVSGN